jgi:hypothetical protein
VNNAALEPAPEEPRSSLLKPHECRYSNRIADEFMKKTKALQGKNHFSLFWLFSLLFAALWKSRSLALARPPSPLGPEMECAFRA